MNPLPWMQKNRRAIIWASPLLIVFLIVYFISERSAPFHPDMTSYVAPQGRPGEEILFEVPMKRDLDKGCSMRLTRTVVDSTFASRAYGPAQEVSAEGLRIRNKLSSSELRMKIVVPETLPSGPSHILTDITYTCSTNPTTYIVPVQLELDWPFYVLPPDPKKVIVVPVP